jgi:prepilin signal peptidase PulO-like enzyme (type II secretory pathway)
MMIWAAALIGYVVGVFLNLCADFLPLIPRMSPFRLPTCDFCGRQRRPVSLAGIIADLAGWSRCLGCGARRPLRAPLVEAGTAVAFAFLAQRYGFTLEFAFMAAYFSALILILVTDIEHRLILDIVTLPAMALALAGSFFMPNMTPAKALIGGAIGFGLFYLLAVLARGGLGGGDVTLMGFVGLATGFPVVLVAILAGILLGGVGAGILLALRRAGRKSYIAYGPYLVLGGAFALLYGREFLLWYFAPYL